MGKASIILIILSSYLRKTIVQQGLLERWKSKATILQFVGPAFLLLDIFTKQHILFGILSNLAIIGLLYLIHTNRDLAPAKPAVLALAPLVVIDLAQYLLQLINTAWYKKWSGSFSTAEFFAFAWMLVLFIINNRQRKALEKERMKAAEIEKEFVITQQLKDELELQVQQRTAELTQKANDLQHALSELKSTQSQLVHSEKMASLGELTAGIAHEIQNPLNFVNNFSEVSAELIAELVEEVDKGNSAEIKLIAADVKSNLDKINHHGKRADAIVKGMLQHSRTSTGKKELTDINALADEYLRLAFHGLRAKDKSFNAKFDTAFDSSINLVEVVPQEIGRVLLNLINNAFQATAERQKYSGAGYQPTVIVSTQRAPDAVLVKVRDNGTGIPDAIKDKIFQPFFTTKPTGEGTGLGLSLAYDMAKAHGGELKVKSKENEGSEFILRLPVGISQSV